MTAFYDTFSTRFGPFSIAVDEHGAVLATAFGDRDRLRVRLRAPAVPLVHTPSRLAAARREVLAYCAGRRRDFSLGLAAHGTDFQHRVWTALRRIPPGTTRTYGELAAALGTPRAARAVGRANATNPICLLVPCHRVIGADGSLTGFAFGEDLKRQLLEHERHLAVSRAA